MVTEKLVILVMAVYKWLQVSVTNHRPQYKMPYLQFCQNVFIVFFFTLSAFFVLIPVLLAYQKAEKTKVKVENRNKMPYLKHNPRWSKMLYLQPKYLLYPVKLSEMHFI